MATKYQQEYAAFCAYLSERADEHPRTCKLMVNVILALGVLAKTKGIDQTKALIELQSPADELVKAVGRHARRMKMPDSMRMFVTALYHADIAQRIAKEVYPVICTFPAPPRLP